MTKQLFFIVCAHVVAGIAEAEWLAELQDIDADGQLQVRSNQGPCCLHWLSIVHLLLLPRAVALVMKLLRPRSLIAIPSLSPPFVVLSSCLPIVAQAFLETLGVQEGANALKPSVGGGPVPATSGTDLHCRQSDIAQTVRLQNRQGLAMHLCSASIRIFAVCLLTRLCALATLQWADIEAATQQFYKPGTPPEGIAAHGAVLTDGQERRPYDSLSSEAESIKGDVTKEAHKTGIHNEQQPEKLNKKVQEESAIRLQAACARRIRFSIVLTDTLPNSIDLPIRTQAASAVFWQVF